MDSSHAPAYRLVRRPLPAASAPRLDKAQQRVVDHEGGPLLVLAGPGTGKTTTIVAAVADRIERRGIAAERILVLTFSRKAAAELRERITARLRRTTREPLAVTFHSYAYALARREFVLAGDEPPRLLSAPEQLLEVRRMLRGEAQDGGARWPERLRQALATRGFAEEVRDLLLRAAERGLDGRGLRQLGKQRDRDDWMAAAAFLDRYAARFDLAPVPAYDYAEIVRIAAALLSREETRQRERGAYDVVPVDEEHQRPSAGIAADGAGRGRPCSLRIGRDLISPSTPSGAPRATTRPSDRFLHGDGLRQRRVVALRACRRAGRSCWPLLVARRGPLSGGDAATATWPRCWAGGDPHPGRQSSTQEARWSPTPCAAPTWRDGVPWSSMAVLARSRCTAGAAAAARARRRSPDGCRWPVRTGRRLRAGHQAAAHAAALRAAGQRAAASRPPPPSCSAARLATPMCSACAAWRWSWSRWPTPTDARKAWTGTGNADTLTAALLDPRVAVAVRPAAAPAKRVACACGGPIRDQGRR